jgi:Leucine-rich repeat (LRR) protein
LSNFKLLSQMKKILFLPLLLVLFNAIAQQKEDGIQFSVPSIKASPKETELKPIILEKKEVIKSNIIKDVISNEVDKVDFETEEDWPTLDNLSQICNLDPNKVYSVSISIKNGFPKELLQCTNLRKLVLNGEFKFLPEEIGEFKKLKSLKFNYGASRMTSLPESIKNLSNLEELDIHSASSLEVIPDIFQNMKKLKVLKIGARNLVLPESFKDLTALEELQLSNSYDYQEQIDKSLKEKQLNNFEYIGNLKKLRILNINSQYTTISENWAALQGLEQLTLMHPIGTPIPDCFGKFINLEELTITGFEKRNYNNKTTNKEKQVVAFPASIWKLKNLKKISINDMLFDNLGVISEELPNLKHISFHRGTMKELNNGIKNWTGVEQLLMENCNLTTVSKELSLLSTLKRLELGNNSISNLPAIDKLGYLTSFRLSNNQLTALPDGIEKCRSLEILEVDNNSIEKIPNSEDWFYLSSLSLSNNLIKTIPKSIGKWINLTSINLSANSIENLPEEINNLRKLNTINFSANSISQLPVDLFKGGKLGIINLSNNKIKVLPEGLKSNENLYTIELSNNQIEVLPNDIFQMAYLSTVNFKNNLIKTIPKEGFKKMKNLYTLNLSNNKIESLVGVVFEGTRMGKQEYYNSNNGLNLSNNPIKQLSQEQVEWLKARNYANNQNIFDIIN